MLKRTVGRRVSVPLPFVSYPVPGKRNAPRSDPQVMITHGLMGSSDTWKSFAMQLSRHSLISEGNFACVLGADLRNHGSAPHTDRHTCALMASDIERLVAEQVSGSGPDTGSVVLVGHSMGGLATMHGLIRHANAEHYTDGLEACESSVGCDVKWHDLHKQNAYDALTHDETAVHREAAHAAIRGAVIIDIAPQRPPTFPGLHDDLRVLRDLPLQSIRTPQDFAPHVAKARDAKEMQSHLVANAYFEGEGNDRSARLKVNAKTVAEQLESILLPDKLSTIKHKVETPILFVFGKSSQYHTEEGRELLPHFFSNMETVEVDEAGHLVHVDQRDKLVDVVATFANRVTSN